jgi:hypothetical protein
MLMDNRAPDLLLSAMAVKMWSEEQTWKCPYCEHDMSGSTCTNPNCRQSGQVLAHTASIRATTS